MTQRSYQSMLTITLLSLLLIVIYSLGSVARADTLNLTWVAPLQRVDGTVLLPSEIAGYKLNWSVKGTTQPEKTVTGTSYALDTGTLIGRTCVTLATIDTDGLISDPSPQVCRNAKPTAPTGLTLK